MEAFRRHNAIWRTLRPFAALWARIKFNYRPKVTPLEAPCLIVSNHCTDWDPILLGITVKTHTYFIASEHIFRRGILAKFLVWAQAPIARMKGTTAGDTALTAIRRLKKGHNVTVFPEGNRTYNGESVSIIESTAKLARISGASLAIHRFRGGYLTSPRWSGDSCRRGLLTGEIVRIYSPAELKAMTPAQIADLIREGIHEDAYETQKQWHIPYKGRRLAEHLERALCLCPVCGKLGTLQSEGSRIFCGCGASAVYTEYGFLESETIPYKTVLEWDRWQADTLLAYAKAAGESLLASDSGIDLFEIGEDFDELHHGTGELRLYCDRLEWNDRVFPFEDISGAGLNGPQGLVFTAQSRHFELKSAQVRNLRKYLTLYRAVTDPENILAI